MHVWEDDGESGVVTARMEAHRWRVRTSSGEELMARVSGFLWFCRAEPVVGARVRIVRSVGESDLATIIRYAHD